MIGIPGQVTTNASEYAYPKCAQPQSKWPRAFHAYIASASIVPSFDCLCSAILTCNFDATIERWADSDMTRKQMNILGLGSHDSVIGATEDLARPGSQFTARRRDGSAA